MSVKIITALAVGVITTSAMGMVKCKPFKEEVKAQEQIVNDFGYVIEKLEKKVNQLEGKISDKLAQMDTVQYRIDDVKNLLDQIINEEMNTIDSMQAVEQEISAKQSEVNSLIQTINSTQYQIDNLPARSHARRDALRENNRAKKVLEKVQEQLVLLEQSVTPQRQRLAQLAQEKSSQKGLIMSLEAEKQQMANTKPTLQFLSKKKQDAEAELMNQDLIQQENIRLFNKAQEKVLMCKTYNVKYPVSLEVSKKLYAVGCENYVPGGYQGPHKLDAEAETIAAVCNQ